MSVVDPAPCERCGRVVNGAESMQVAEDDGRIIVVCRWGSPCAGPWVPPDAPPPH